MSEYCWLRSTLPSEEVKECLDIIGKAGESEASYLPVVTRVSKVIIWEAREKLGRRNPKMVRFIQLPDRKPHPFHLGIADVQIDYQTETSEEIPVLRYLEKGSSLIGVELLEDSRKEYIETGILKVKLCRIFATKRM